MPVGTVLRMMRQPPTGLRQLTLANVLTDATRLANVEGDGLPFGSGYGVWPAATNLCINGNATTNTTGITDNSSTTSRVTSGVVKFGTTAFEVVSSNLAANEGPSQSVSGGAGSTQYTVSAWAWLISGAATVRATLSDSVAGKQGGTAVALTTTPQKITVTATTGALGASVASFIETTVQQAGTWRCGGWQVETGNVATPYVQTDGGTATRSAGRVQVPVSGLFSATQAWVAVRLVPGWASASPPGTSEAGVFEWGDGTFNNRLVLTWVEATSEWVVARATGGTYGNSAVSADTFAASTAITLIGAFEATQTRISVDGAAFSNAANTTIPDLSAVALADIGAETADLSRKQAGHNPWAVIGKGSLTDADAARINSWGNTVPTLAQIAMLSFASKPTLLIPAKTADAVLLPAYFGG